MERPATRLKNIVYSLTCLHQCLEMDDERQKGKTVSSISQGQPIIRNSDFICEKREGEWISFNTANIIHCEALLMLGYQR